MLKQLSSASHPLVKHLVKLRQNSDYRYEHHCVMVEGIKMIQELSHAHVFECVVISHQDLLHTDIKAKEIFWVTDEIMKKISGMQTPEGIIAVMPMPKPASLKGLKKIIIFDGIADPGNMGTLLRSALALGWQGAFIIENSCDPFNDKALRAARGATFRLPLARGNWEDAAQLIDEGKLEAVAADLHGENLSDVTIQDGAALVLGNEARGISAKAQALCRRVTIPMPGDMESLNVSIAGSIMMFALNHSNKGK